MGITFELENVCERECVCDTNENVASNEFGMTQRKDEGGCQVYL